MIKMLLEKVKAINCSFNYFDYMKVPYGISFPKPFIEVIPDHKKCLESRKSFYMHEMKSLQMALEQRVEQGLESDEADLSRRMCPADRSVYNGVLVQNYSLHGMCFLEKIDLDMWIGIYVFTQTVRQL